MTFAFEKLIDTLTISRLIIIYLLWILAFGIFYSIAPEIHGSSILTAADKTPIRDLGQTLFFSLGTATGADFSGLRPQGPMRIAAAIEVLGALICAGTAINLLAALPSRTTRLAARACTGWWIEEITMPGDRTYYSVSKIVKNGNIITKDGQNYDLNNGPMDKMTYVGRLLTAYFPTIISRYENDVHSQDYSDGFFKFDMKVDSKGTYVGYAGSCYDRDHGCRDRIIGHKVIDSESIYVLERFRRLNRQQIKRLISEYFPSAVLRAKKGEA